MMSLNEARSAEDATRTPNAANQRTAVAELPRRAGHQVRSSPDNTERHRIISLGLDTDIPRIQRPNFVSSENIARVQHLLLSDAHYIQHGAIRQLPDLQQRGRPQASQLGPSTAGRQGTSGVEQIPIMAGHGSFRHPPPGLRDAIRQSPNIAAAMATMETRSRPQEAEEEAVRIRGYDSSVDDPNTYPVLPSITRRQSEHLERGKGSGILVKWSLPDLRKIERSFNNVSALEGITDPAFILQVLATHPAIDTIYMSPMLHPTHPNYTPYLMHVAYPGKVDILNCCVVTRNNVIRYIRGKEPRCLSLKRWSFEQSAMMRLRNIQFFKNFKLMKAFYGLGSHLDMSLFGKTRRKIRANLIVCNPSFAETLLLVRTMSLDMAALALIHVDAELTYTLGEFLEDQEQYSQEVSGKLERYLTILLYLISRTCWDVAIAEGLAEESKGRRGGAPKRVNEIRKLQRLRQSSPGTRSRHLNADDINIGTWVKGADPGQRAELERRKKDQCGQLSRFIYLVDCLIRQALYEVFVASLRKTADFLTLHLKTFPSDTEIGTIVKGYVGDLDDSFIFAVTNNDDDGDSGGGPGSQLDGKTGGDRRGQGMSRNDKETANEKAGVNTQSTGQGGEKAEDPSNTSRSRTTTETESSSTWTTLRMTSSSDRLQADSYDLGTPTIMDNALYLAVQDGEAELSDSLETTSSTLSGEEGNVNPMGASEPGDLADTAEVDALMVVGTGVREIVPHHLSDGGLRVSVAYQPGRGLVVNAAGRESQNLAVNAAQQQSQNLTVNAAQQQSQNLAVNVAQRQSQNLLATVTDHQGASIEQDADLDDVTVIENVYSTTQDRHDPTATPHLSNTNSQRSLPAGEEAITDDTTEDELTITSDEKSDPVNKRSDTQSNHVTLRAARSKAGVHRSSSGLKGSPAWVVRKMVSLATSGGYPGAVSPIVATASLSRFGKKDRIASHSEKVLDQPLVILKEQAEVIGSDSSDSVCSLPKDTVSSSDTGPSRHLPPHPRKVEAKNAERNKLVSQDEAVSNLGSRRASAHDTTSAQIEDKDSVPIRISKLSQNASLPFQSRVSAVRDNDALAARVSNVSQRISLPLQGKVSSVRDNDVVTARVSSASQPVSYPLQGRTSAMRDNDVVAGRASSIAQCTSLPLQGGSTDTVKDHRLGGIFGGFFGHSVESSVDGKSHTDDHESIVTFPILDRPTWVSVYFGSYTPLRSSRSSSVDDSGSQNVGNSPVVSNASDGISAHNDLIDIIVRPRGIESGTSSNLNDSEDDATLAYACDENFDDYFPFNIPGKGGDKNTSRHESSENIKPTTSDRCKNKSDEGINDLQEADMTISERNMEKIYPLIEFQSRNGDRWLPEFGGTYQNFDISSELPSRTSDFFDQGKEHVYFNANTSPSSEEKDTFYPEGFILNKENDNFVENTSVFSPSFDFPAIAQSLVDDTLLKATTQGVRKDGGKRRKTGKVSQDVNSAASATTSKVNDLDIKDPEQTVQLIAASDMTLATTSKVNNSLDFKSVEQIVQQTPDNQINIISESPDSGKDNNSATRSQASAVDLKQADNEDQITSLPDILTVSPEDSPEATSGRKDHRVNSLSTPCILSEESSYAKDLMQLLNTLPEAVPLLFNIQVSNVPKYEVDYPSSFHGHDVHFTSATSSFVRPESPSTVSFNEDADSVCTFHVNTPIKEESAEDFDKLADFPGRQENDTENDLTESFFGTVADDNAGSSEMPTISDNEAANQDHTDVEKTSEASGSSGQPGTSNGDNNKALLETNNNEDERNNEDDEDAAGSGQGGVPGRSPEGGTGAGGGGGGGSGGSGGGSGGGGGSSGYLPANKKLWSPDLKPMFHASLSIDRDMVSITPDVYDFTAASFNVVHDMEMRLRSMDNLTSNPAFHTFTLPTSEGHTSVDKQPKGPNLDRVIRLDSHVTSLKNTVYGSIDNMFHSVAIYTKEMQALYLKYFQDQHLDLDSEDKDVDFYCRHLQRYDVQMKIADRLPESQRLGMFLIDLTPYKEYVRQCTLAGLQHLQLELNADVVRRTRALIEKLNDLHVTLESHPTALVPLFKRLTALDSCDVILRDLENSDVSRIGELYSVIDRFDVPHTEVDRRAFESTHYLITSAAHVAEACQPERDSVVEAIVKCLARDVRYLYLQAKRVVRPLVEASILLDGRADPAEVRRVLIETETVVRSHVAMANFVREVQRYLGIPTTRFTELFHLSSRYVNTRNLWLLMSDWDAKVEKWKHQSFQTLAIQEINTYTFKYMEACDKVERLLPKNTVIAAFEEKMDVMLRWLNFIIEFRGQSVKPRHWRQIEEVLGVEFGEQFPLTLASLMSINAIEKQKTLHVILNKARAESNVQSEYDEVVHQCRTLTLPVQTRQKSLVEGEPAVTFYFLGDTFEIEESLNYFVMELERIELSPHSGFLHEALEQFVQRIFEALEKLVQWMEMQMKLSRLRRLIMRHSEVSDTLPEEVARYKQIYTAYSDFMRTVQPDANVLSWCRSQELQAIIEAQHDEIVRLYRTFKRDVEIRGGQENNQQDAQQQFGTWVVM